MTFRQQQTGELYYDLNGAFFRGDPWSSIYFAGGWGDGTLVYPGSNSTHTTLGAAQVGVSTPIWIPSIRLKMMRDGYQDYEYLYLLNSLGGASATLVTNEISSWITNGYEFNPTIVPSSTIYFPDPQQSVTFTGDLPDARYALGTAIHQLSYTVVLQPPTNLTATVN